MSQSNSIDSQELPQPPSPPKSSGMKALTSCGCGCAVLLLVVAVTGVLLFRHFLGPGDQVPTDHLLGEDTVFIAHMDAPVDDAGAKEFLAELFHTIATLDPEGMDPEARKVFKDFLDSTRNLSMDDANDFVGLMPSSITFLLEDNGTELTSLFGLNLSKGSKLLNYVVTEAADGSQWDTKEWGEYEIMKPEFDISGESYTWDEDAGELVLREGVEEGDPTEFGFVSFQHDTFLWSDNIETMQRALDRTTYEDEPGPPAETVLRKDLDSLRERWLVSTVLRNSPRLDLPGFGSELLEGIFGEDDEAGPLYAAPEELEWLGTDFDRSTLGLGFVGDDLVLRIEVKGLQEADVSKVARGFEAMLGRISETMAKDEVTLAHEVIQGTTSLAINANLEDLRLLMKREFTDGRGELVQPDALPEPAEPEGD